LNEQEIKAEIARLQNLKMLVIKGAQTMLDEAIAPIEKQIKELQERLAEDNGNIPMVRNVEQINQLR